MEGVAPRRAKGGGTMKYAMADSKLSASRALICLSASKICLTAALVIALLLSGAATALANDWVVKRVFGKVYLVAPGVQAFLAKPGMRIEPGYTVATKAGAKALIMRGEESIFVGPDTRFALSKYRSTSINTTLLQASGHLQIDVQRRAKPHFKVETPFLAAIVKGTKFDVRVSDRSARVDVSRGLVEVSDHSSGDRANVGAGESAASEPSRSVGLQVGGNTTPAVTQGPRSAPVFESPALPGAPQATPEVSSPTQGGGRSARDRFFSEEQFSPDRGRDRKREDGHNEKRDDGRDKKGRESRTSSRGNERFDQDNRADNRGKGGGRDRAGDDRGSRAESRGDRNESRGNDRGESRDHGGGRNESDAGRGGKNDDGGKKNDSRNDDRGGGKSQDGRDGGRGKDREDRGRDGEGRGKKGGRDKGDRD